MLAGTSWALAPPKKLDWTRLKGWNASDQTLFFFYLSYQIFFFFSLLTFLSFLFILLKTQPPALQMSWLTAACNHVDVETPPPPPLKMILIIYKLLLWNHFLTIVFWSSSACTTTELSILLTSCLTAIKNHVIKYCTNLFWSITNSGEILNKLKSRGFLASGLSTYDFSTLYTTLPHNLIKEKLTELIEQTFNREGSLYLACNDKNAFFTSEQPKRYKLWSCQKMCDALHYLLDNIFIRFGSKLYRQIVGIPMGTNCAPLVADLFLFCYDRDFMLSLSDNNQADIIEAFNSTSRYLDDLLNIDNPYFEQMVDQIYPTELQLNKANSSDTEAPFLDLNLSVTNGIVSSKIYDKRDDFNFEIVNFPFLDGDVPCSPSYGVYISPAYSFC